MQGKRLLVIGIIHHDMVQSTVEHISDRSILAHCVLIYV